MDYSCANWLRVVPVQLNYGMPIKGIYPVKLRWCWPGDQQPEPGIWSLIMHYPMFPHFLSCVPSSHNLVGLLLYLANIFEAMKAFGRKLQAYLRWFVRTGLSKPFPQQRKGKMACSFTSVCPLASFHIQGNRHKQHSVRNMTILSVTTISILFARSTDSLPLMIADLLHRLKTVEQVIDPYNQATVALMQT